MFRGGLAILVSSCESNVSLNPLLADGGVTDALACPICADVSVDANYDAPEVSIYGIQPADADAPGSHDGASAAAMDAAADGAD